MNEKPFLDEQSKPTWTTKNSRVLPDPSILAPSRIADSHLIMNGLSQVAAALGVENDTTAIFLVADYLREILAIGLETHISIEREALLLRAYAPLLGHMHGMEIKTDLVAPSESCISHSPRHLSCDILGAIAACLSPGPFPEFVVCRLQVDAAAAAALRLDVALKTVSPKELKSKLTVALDPFLKKKRLLDAPSVGEQQSGALLSTVVTVRWPLVQDKRH